jgi:hypothetical protein
MLHLDPFISPIKISAAMVAPSTAVRGIAGGTRSVGGIKNVGTTPTPVAHLRKIEGNPPPSASGALQSTRGGIKPPAPANAPAGSEGAQGTTKAASDTVGVSGVPHMPGITRDGLKGEIPRSPTEALQEWQAQPVLKGEPPIPLDHGKQAELSVGHLPVSEDAHDTMAHAQRGLRSLNPIGTAADLIDGLGNRSLDILEANQRKSRRPMDPTLAVPASQPQLY